MANTTFMSAGIEIEGLVDKKEAILKSAGNLIAEACIGRIKEGKISQNLEKDILNLIKSFPEADQAIILRKAMVAITNSMAGNGSSKKERSNSNNNGIFANRGF